jgi:hypothetical protein
MKPKETALPEICYNEKNFNDRKYSKEIHLCLIKESEQPDRLPVGQGGPAKSHPVIPG